MTVPAFNSGIKADLAQGGIIVLRRQAARGGPPEAAFHRIMKDELSFPFLLYTYE